MADADLGRRIRRAREAKRLHGQPWTQQYLASLLGVSVRTVGRWERGTVPRSSIGALEQVLGVNLAEDTDPEREQLLAVLADLRERLGKTEEEFSAQKKAVLAEYDERKRRHHGGGDPRQRIA